MQITVVMRNLTPIHSSEPVKDTIGLDGTIGKPKGFPFVRMRSLKVPVDSADGVTKVVHLPIIPANTMRNSLRRSILNTVFGSLRGRETLSIGAYAAACSGNASGNPEGVAASFDETMEVRGHVFTGLFGGGPRMIKSRMSVENMYPIHRDSARVIGDGFEERMISGNVRDILDVVWKRRVDPIEKNSDEETEQLITNARQSITEWAINAQDRKAKSKAKDKPAEEGDEASATRGLNALNAHEVVLPGIDWAWNILLDRPTEAQVALVLKGIQDIENNALLIGGGNASGQGRMKIQEIRLDGERYDPHGDRAMQLGDALVEALDQLSAEQFESFVRPSKGDE